jgi:hypothetical protein
MVTLDPQVGSGEAFGACIGDAPAWIFVEMFTVSHTDKAAFDGDIDALTRGGDHPRGGDLGHDLVVIDVKITDGAGGMAPPQGLILPARSSRATL